MTLSPEPGAQNRCPGPNQRIKDELDRLIDELVMPLVPDESPRSQRPSREPALIPAALTPAALIPAARPADQDNG